MTLQLNASYKVVVPDTKFSVLSEPSKMPCFGFGIPAKHTCPNSNGSICNGTVNCDGTVNHDGCYAFERGFYKMDNVQDSQWARFDWTKDAVKTEAGLNAWVEYMVQTIKRATARTAEKLFRIHDSGDFFSPRYARGWRMVAERLPEVDFWAPFRGWQRPTSTGSVLNPFKVMTEKDGLFAELLKMAKLPNVTLRPSALNFDDNPPAIDGFAAGTTASDSTVDGCYQCPAKSQGNQCGDCRVCWHDKHVPVCYAKH